jgi:hypothetical protein
VSAEEHAASTASVTRVLHPATSADGIVELEQQVFSFAQLPPPLLAAEPEVFEPLVLVLPPLVLVLPPLVLLPVVLVVVQAFRHEVVTQASIAASAVAQLVMERSFRHPEVQLVLLHSQAE